MGKGERGARGGGGWITLIRKGKAGSDLRERERVKSSELMSRLGQNKIDFRNTRLDPF